MFLYTGQVVYPRMRFAGTVTGTPTAQLYVNGVASGSAVNGTGSTDFWVFAVTMPTLVVGNYIEIEVTGTVSGVVQRKIVLQASAVEIVAGGGGGGLDAAGVRAAVGLTSPDLDAKFIGLTNHVTNASQF